MKAISIHQPWASLLVTGRKRFETRAWHTNYRGPLAIHASRLLTSIGTHLTTQKPYQQLLATIGVDTYKDLVLGKILGQATLVDCWRVMEIPDANLPTETELAIGNFGTKQGAREIWTWLFTDPKPLTTPFATGGTLGLWEIDDYLYNQAEHRQSVTSELPCQPASDSPPPGLRPSG